MKRILESVMIFVAICVAGVSGFDSKMARDQLVQLSAENERLRLFNTRRERRLKWMAKPKGLNTEAVAKAWHILGIPPSAVAALIYTENGPQDLETGSIDKTDFFAANLPIECWSTLDGSRTLNRMLWEWMLESQEGRKALPHFLVSAAGPYTAGRSDHEKRLWANHWLQWERIFKAKLLQGPQKGESLVVAIKTPTD